MTPQILVVRIQTVLTGAGEHLDARSLALEYSRQCSAVRKRLEHCVGLLKSGRDYAAIQVAETEPQLFEHLNALSFKELPLWRSYCQKAMLPVPPPFDEGQIKLVQGLYSKGITQTHPFYRDYRRAIRMRNLDEALFVMRSITRINSFDGEAKREYARLCERIIKVRMQELSDAFENCDKEKIIEICALLDSFSEQLNGNELWKKASNMRDSLEKERDIVFCQNLLKELRSNPQKDMEDLSQKLSDFNLLRNLRSISFPQDDLDFIEQLSKKVFEYEKEKIKKEECVRARNELLSAVEISVSEDCTFARLKKIKSLLDKSGTFAEDELRARAKSFISSLQIRLFVSTLLRTSVIGVCLFGIIYTGGVLYSDYSESKNLKAAAFALAEIGREESFMKRSEMLDSFEQNYAEVLNAPFIRRSIERISQLNLKEGRVYDRISKGVLELEKSNFNKLSDKNLEGILGKLKYLDSEVEKISETMTGFDLKERLVVVRQKMDEAVDTRKKAIRSEIREQLELYDGMVAEYSDIFKPLDENDKKFGQIMKKLRPRIENISGPFAAQKFEVERYNDISEKVSTARKSAQALDSVLKIMKNSRTSSDYYAALEKFSKLDFINESALEDASKAINKKTLLESAGISLYTKIEDLSGVENMSGFSSSSAIFSEEILTNVYVYSLTEKPKVYTLGKAEERQQKWNISRETIQEVQEIFLGGKIMKNIYKLIVVGNKPPQGELLAGGSLTPESLLGRELVKISGKKSAIESIPLIVNSKVNALYKIFLEKKLFAFMEKDPLASGLGLSESLMKRKEKIAELGRGVAEYSWMFDSSSRASEIADVVYSENIPDYFAEAMENLKNLKLLKAFPHMFVGFADIKGNPEIFDTSDGVFWAISSAGEVKKYSSKKELSELAPFTPIMKENKNRK